MHVAVRLWYIAAAINVGSAKLTRIHIDPATQFFVDESGRARIFHGVNAVEKVGGVFFDMFRMDSPSHSDQSMTLCTCLGGAVPPHPVRI